ncbi:MAG: FtsX-like permease family protein [Roseivirga sp.]|nr:FtsX-like permease family protein [Roseivirga sp.]
MKSNRNIAPPRWADRFLAFYCREEFLEEIAGDAHELFEVRLQDEGRQIASLLFIWDVLRFFRWSNIKSTNRSKITQLMMVKNNFKIATRSLVKHKFYTGINLVGISLGIACFILTYLYVHEELSFDKFHSQKDRLYRVWIHEFDEGDEYFEGVVPMVLTQYMENDFPEIIRSAQMQDKLARYQTPDGTQLTSMIDMVGSDFLRMFDFPLIAGSLEGVLDSPADIVLTKSEAIRRLGTTDVIGKSIEYDIRGENAEFVVSGLVNDPPVNSSLEFVALISDVNKKRFVNEQSLTSWYTFSTELYVLLNERNDVSGLEEKFTGMVETGLGEDYEEGTYTVHLQPLTDMHFNQQIDGDTPVGDINTVRILGLIGFVILFLAGINFVNLSVGQSMTRAKEVGVRKVMGAFKKQLTIQFLTESLLLTLMAALIGLGVSYLLLPVFNQFADKNLQLAFDAPLIQALLLCILFTGVLAGLYPAFVLSSFNPSKVLKGLHKSTQGKHGLAFSLIVIQYVAAIFFVSSTVIMKNQIHYMSELDMGFNKEAKVYFTLPAAKAESMMMQARMKANADQAKVFISEMSQLISIEKISAANNFFGDRGWVKLGYEDKEEELNYFHYNHIDEHFIDLFDMEIVQGQGFDEATTRLRETGMIVNEAFVKAYGIENPIGHKLEGPDFPEHQIIGVVKDFNFSSLHEKIGPLIMSMNAHLVFEGINSIEVNQSLKSTLVAKVDMNAIDKFKGEIEAIWEERYAEPFELGFLDSRIERMYEAEKRNDAMVSLIALLAVVIASLGLLGLVALTVQKKFKEIGIRKVLGASSYTIIKMLNKAFLSPIAIALLLSLPLTYFVMQSWLDDFAYHININPVHFLLAGALIFMTTLLVASYQSVRAAATNPVDTLRYE